MPQEKLLGSERGLGLTTGSLVRMPENEELRFVLVLNVLSLLKHSFTDRGSYVTFEASQCRMWSHRVIKETLISQRPTFSQ